MLQSANAVFLQQRDAALSDEATEKATVDRLSVTNARLRARVRELRERLKDRPVLVGD